MIKGNMSEFEEWLRLAKMDADCADILLKSGKDTKEAICFHCHQSAEKYLKALLVLHNITPPKTHDLTFLVNMCKKNNIGLNMWNNLKKEIVQLTTFGVKPRYPFGLQLDTQDVREVLSDLQHIRTAILKTIYEYLNDINVLDIPPDR